MRGYGFGFRDLMSHAGPVVIRTFDIGKGQAAKDEVDAFDGHDALDRLGGIAVPTLVLAGGHDIATPPALGGLVAERIPGAVFEVTEGEAHQPFGVVLLGVIRLHQIAAEEVVDGREATGVGMAP